MSSVAHKFRPAIAAALVAIIMGACGSDAQDDIALSPSAEQGRELTRSRGCSGCHGGSGEGGVGPAFVGLYGSTVEFEEGPPVTADAAYLFESIRDPRARQVAGYGLRMPINSLTDDEIDLIIQYIEELAEVTP